jgi:hypothetical protein
MEPLTLKKRTNLSKGINPLNSTWVIWYHNPSDNNWETSSYKKLYEFSSLDEFFMFQNTWKNNLPKLNLSMMFMMKKMDNYEFIYPMWEDKNNQPGGCWSFKVPSTNIDNVWLQLCFHIITENTGDRQEVNDSVNGISFSPKKGFCIVKIWNSTTDIQDVNELNSDINTFMDLSTCIYKSHVESINKDNKKKKKIQDFRNNIDRREKDRLAKRNNRHGKQKNQQNQGSNRPITNKTRFTENGYKNNNNSSGNYIDYKKRFNTGSKFAWGKSPT